MDGMMNVSAVSAGFQTPEAAKPVPSGQVTAAEHYEKAAGSPTAVENIAAAEEKTSEKTEKQVSQEEREKALDVLKEQLKNTKLQIRYNEEVNRFAITVKDGNSDKVIREIPSEESLKILERNLEVAGILVDARR